jgi:hypothetical protein
VNGCFSRSGNGTDPRGEISSSLPLSLSFCAAGKIGLDSSDAGGGD